MEKFYNYILQCHDGTLYSGYTTDPVKRLNAHNRGRGAKYTRSRIPVKIAALWQWDNRSSAMKAEYRIKRMQRSEKLRLISGTSLLEGAIPADFERLLAEKQKTGDDSHDA